MALNCKRRVDKTGDPSYYKRDNCAEQKGRKENGMKERILRIVLMAGSVTALLGIVLAIVLKGAPDRKSGSETGQTETTEATEASEVAGIAAAVDGTADQKEENTVPAESKAITFKAEGSYFYLCDGETEKPIYLNGVNVGAGVPGHFPGELAIDQETYIRWFREISELGCNCIRTYTTMKPAFYEALFAYNRSAEKPLYLLMGIWYDEQEIESSHDAFQVLEYAVSEAEEQIDIIHGDCQIKERPGRAYGIYSADISPYVIGWILGIESDAEFVGGTNEQHPEITYYKGEYLSMKKKGTAFDAFLCEVGDRTIAYEMEHYGMQRPLSFANWPTADDLHHPEEPTPDIEDAVSINMERYQPEGAFTAGLFASYHIYPYYPEFMSVQTSYREYRNAEGKPDPYEAYLKDLRAIHTMPVLVAEFGIPTSRGCTHTNDITGFNQGHVTEKEQGEMLTQMAETIFQNDYCGGILFSWQDEWFKRTWNTMDYTDPERRVFWSDVQTSEQNFGLLSFDPGLTRMQVLVDGDFEDWEGERPLVETGGLRLYVQQDVRYLYLCVAGENFSPERDTALIPVDITPVSGAFQYESYALDHGADFMIILSGKTDSRVLTQSYYDRYAFMYTDYDKEFADLPVPKKDSTEFRPVYLMLNKQLTFPDGRVRETEKTDTGLLRYGNGDPASENYDSLVDFCYGKGFVEIRIPWSLLSFRDPSSKEVEADFWENGELSGMTVPEIFLGLCRDDKCAPMQPYTWENWDQPVTHERKKQSYDMVKACFERLQL